MRQYKPTFKDTKVILKRIKEYSGRWIDACETIFLKGKLTNEQITDCICKMCSTSRNVIIDADFEVGEVTLDDYAKFC